MKDERDLFEKARKRVEDIKGFYTHLVVYILVNAFLLILNLITSTDTMWFIWPLLGWGIGLFVHFLSVFVLEGFFGSDWEDRKIKDLMDKYKKNDPTG